MEKILDIIDNGRRIVIMKYTDAEISAYNANMVAEQERLQREYDLNNLNTSDETDLSSGN